MLVILIIFLTGHCCILCACICRIATINKTIECRKLEQESCVTCESSSHVTESDYSKGGNDAGKVVDKNRQNGINHVHPETHGSNR